MLFKMMMRMMNAGNEFLMHVLTFGTNGKYMSSAPYKFWNFVVPKFLRIWLVVFGPF